MIVSWNTDRIKKRGRPLKEIPKVVEAVKSNERLIKPTNIVTKSALTLSLIAQIEEDLDDI